MNTTTLQITGMNCGACVAHVTKALSAAPGVRSVKVDLPTGRAVVEHDGAETARLIAALKEEDYSAEAV